MIVLETLIVIIDYPSLVDNYESKESRTRWGVICNPILNNGNWVLPLGWEEELTKAGIEFEVMEVEVIKEEI